MKNLCFRFLPFLFIFAHIHTTNASGVSNAVFSSSTCQSTFKHTLFNSTDPLEISIRADFGEIKRRAIPQSLGQSTSVASEDTQFVPAMVNGIEAKIRARGMSSLYEGELDFPKLRIELNKKDLNLLSSIFAVDSKFLINTHGGETDQRQRTDNGRILGDIAPMREAFAYDLARTLSLPVPLYRRAIIEYIDTSTGKSFTRKALILETSKNRARRLHAEIMDLKAYDNSSSPVTPSDGARHHLFQLLIGNADFGLRVNELPGQFLNLETSYRPLFNTEVYVRQDGTKVAVVYDLDYSYAVMGTYSIDQWSPDNTMRIGDNLEDDFYLRLQDLKVKFNDHDLTSAIDHFRKNKTKLYELVESLTDDIEGKLVAIRLLNRFFENIDKAMAQTVIAAVEVGFYSDSALSKSALKEHPYTGQASSLPLGTPVRILEKRNNSIKVELMGVSSILKEGASSIGYIRSGDSISRTIPKELVGHLDERLFINILDL